MTARSRGVECEVCNRWFHAKLQQISNTEYDCMENQFWMCSFCRENDKTDINHSSETKVCLRYVDDIVRTVRGDTKELLDAAVNNLHQNLQFTLETTDDKNSVPFLDMSINVQPEGNMFCTWYQKPSDTGTTLNYRICAPLQHNENWERNQYPRHWVGNVARIQLTSCG